MCVYIYISLYINVKVCMRMRLRSCRCYYHITFLLLLKSSWPQEGFGQFRGQGYPMGVSAHPKVKSSEYVVFRCEIPVSMLVSGSDGRALA